ncbi:hypothetical protein OG500_15085 [Kitasatospora sp. NBC_01250]|uniref:hypothetical protein n=1 Tax=unclassified Kitasatospora TaxID=2633591 RepID=UPI002E13D0E1|nr:MULTISPECIES: hypothetical protein [unclassified Kitasatospora]WSJ67503.1 hypothetical protein OG294_16085 [Kitasatospora sp. NBC_01302]
MTDTSGWASPGSSGTDSSGTSAEGVRPPAAAPGGPDAASATAPPPSDAAPQAAPPFPGAYGRPPAGPTAPQPAQGWGPQPGWGGQPGWGTQPGWGGQQGWAVPPPSPKPGVIPLRPLGVGEILDGSIATVRKHWQTVLGLSLVVALLTQTTLTFVDWWSQHDSQDTAGLVVAGVGLLVDAVASLLMSALLTMVVSRAILGEPVSAGAAWRAARPQLWRLTGLTMLVMLIVVGILVAGAVPIIVLAALGDDGPAPMAIGFLILLGAGLVAFWTYFRLSLATPALMLEKQGVKAALARSRKLVRGAWWRIFGISLLGSFLTAMLASVIAIPFRAVAAVAGGSLTSALGGTTDHPQPVSALVIIAVGGVIGSMLTIPVQAAINVLLYVDQRIRREALDLELARAAGLPEYGGSGWAGRDGGAA